MKLTKVTINAFRTILTKQEIDVDPKITVLIGANEAGKTNLLHAMKCFSIQSDLKPEDISKSRRRKYARKELPELTFTFFISEQDRKELSKYVSELAHVDCFSIRKNQNGIDGYQVYIPKDSFMRRKRKQVETLRNTLLEKKKEEESLKKEKEKAETTLISIDKQLKNGGITQRRKKRLHEKQKNTTESLRNLQIQIEKLDLDIQETQEHIELLQQEVEKPKDLVLTIGADQKQNLIKLLPSISYFKDLELIPESIPVDEVVKQNTPRSIVVGNLLRVGEIEDLTILNEPPRRIRPILRSIASVVSEKLSETWKQELLRVELAKEGPNLVISIDEPVAVSSSPQERSEGFQWFLSFFAAFMGDWSEKTSRKIILLDEPAIRLHPKGQKDFLEILENISETNQVIYTSHSPFLINRNFPLRLRLLEKDNKKGTIINNKPYSNGKSRFWEPLRSAIGIYLGDLLSFGETNLIVEGISDQIILTGISNKFAEINVPFIDLEQTSIVPAMGSECVVYLAQFAVSENLKTFALLDGDSKGKKAFSKLKNELKIDAVSIDQLKKNAVTIEDLIPRSIYIDSINSLYSKIKGEKYVVYENENNRQKPIGIVQEMKKHFEEMGFSLDKVSVARELVRKLKIDKSNLSDYSGFHKLFEMISKS